MKEKILVVDDEPGVVELIQYNLEAAGFSVETASDGAEGLNKAQTLCPNLILLDVMLPEMDGLEVCKILRADSNASKIPIIILSAKTEELDRVVGLELGADDYVTKPFSPRELLLRIKKQLQPARPTEIPKDHFALGILQLDVLRHLVTVKKKRVELTAIEFKLLQMLVQRIGIVQSREQLLREVWNYDEHIDTRTVDTHMRRLREKLGAASCYLDTVHGVGYRFLEEHQFVTSL